MPGPQEDNPDPTFGKAGDESIIIIIIIITTTTTTTIIIIIIIIVIIIIIIINKLKRGYYMAAQGYEFYLGVLKVSNV